MGTDEFRYLPLADVRESPNNPRRNFKGMEELTASVTAHGVLVPLLVRPVDGYMEIIAGARRYRAAKAAKLDVVPARIREMSDDEALELQVVENLQREDVHPMEEAVGYQHLLARPGYDIPGVAAKVGRSESYVYQRLKLLDLIKEARTFFLEEKITAGHAILIARLQPADQKEALTECFNERFNRGKDRQCRWSVRDLSHWIQESIHLDLHAAPFKKDDPDLVPAAGPCTTCPKRTGFAPALLPDIAHKDTCTDRVCYESKMHAFMARKAAEIAAEGQKPILLTEDDSYSMMHRQKKGDPKLVPADKYREVSKKDRCASTQKGIVVKGWNKRGQVLEVCADPNCKKHHPGGYQRPQADIDRDRRLAEERSLETEVHRQLLERILESHPAGLDVEDWHLIARSFTHEMQNDDAKFICKRHGWDPARGQYSQKDYRKAITQEIAKRDLAALSALLIELCLARYATAPTWGNSKPVELLDTARRLKINPGTIRAKITAARRVKKLAKKAREKKTAAAKKVDKSASKSAKVEKSAEKSKRQPGVCEDCGRTETAACTGPLGPCAWSRFFRRQKRWVCTMCEAPMMEDEAQAARIEGAQE